MRGRNSETDKQQLEAKEWRARAIRLRCQGFTLREIAAKCQKSHAMVHAAIDEARKAVPVEDVKHLREQQAEEIRVLKRKWRTAALAGVKDAAEIYIKACTREAKLLGLDAPEKTELEIKHPASPEEAIERVKRILAENPELASLLH